jgi:hypothetical protein
MVATARPQIGTRHQAEIAAPRRPELIPAPEAATSGDGAAQSSDANFPAHMLLWTVIGVIAYFAVIAAAMIYAAVLSPAAFR